MRVHQPLLPLGFGSLRWDTLPLELRSRLLELWIQLLRDHLEREKAAQLVGE